MQTECIRIIDLAEIIHFIIEDYASCGIMESRAPDEVDGGGECDGHAGVVDDGDVCCAMVTWEIIFRVIVFPRVCFRERDVCTELGCKFFGC